MCMFICFVTYCSLSAYASRCVLFYCCSFAIREIEWLCRLHGEEVCFGCASDPRSDRSGSTVIGAPVSHIVRHVSLASTSPLSLTLRPPAQDSRERLRSLHSSSLLHFAPVSYRTYPLFRLSGKRRSIPLVVATTVLPRNTFSSLSFLSYSTELFSLTFLVHLAQR